MARFRIAVVGCGGVSHYWLLTLCARADVEIVAVVDAAPERAHAAVAEHGLTCPVFASLEEALALGEANLVVNLTPPPFHRTIVGAALEAGCDVFGEKPLAATIEEARELLDLVGSTGRTYVVMQQRRFLSHARVLREAIADGRIGTPTEIGVDFFRSHPPDSNGFLGQMESPLLLDLAIHHFDLVRFITGVDALSVYCHEFNPKESPYRGAAAAVCIFELSDGSVFSFRGSWSAKGAETSWGASWRIVGTLGTVLWDGEGPPVADLAAGREEWNWIDEPDTDQAACIEATLDALAAGEIPQTVATDNIKSLAMVTGAVASAQEGRPVAIWPLEPR